MEFAKLTRYGLLSVSGADAREFLHAQLTNDIQNLSPERAALAGWCSAKGRLLASFLVIPAKDGFLLQLARDLVPGVSKRLAMFVLRSKVRIEDVSDRLHQFGTWTPGSAMTVRADGPDTWVQVDAGRSLLVTATEKQATIGEERWTVDEIKAGRAFITAATQDLFVPQMVNFEKLGGIDFQKGCYPGQEIVARAQYRGEVKRRMVRLPAPAGVSPKPGEEFNGGVVVDSAGGEVLAVLPV